MKRPKPQRITARSLSNEVAALREEVEALKREIGRLRRQPVPQDPWGWPPKPYTPIPHPRRAPDEWAPRPDIPWDDRPDRPARPYFHLDDPDQIQGR